MHWRVQPPGWTALHKIESCRERGEGISYLHIWGGRPFFCMLKWDSAALPCFAVSFWLSNLLLIYGKATITCPVFKCKLVPSKLDTQEFVTLKSVLQYTFQKRNHLEYAWLFHVDIIWYQVYIITSLHYYIKVQFCNISITYVIMPKA